MFGSVLLLWCVQFSVAAAVNAAVLLSLRLQLCSVRCCCVVFGAAVCSVQLIDVNAAVFCSVQCSCVLFSSVQLCSVQFGAAVFSSVQLCSVRCSCVQPAVCLVQPVCSCVQFGAAVFSLLCAWFSLLCSVQCHSNSNSVLIQLQLCSDQCDSNSNSTLIQL